MWPQVCRPPQLSILFRSILTSNQLNSQNLSNTATQLPHGHLNEREHLYLISLLYLILYICVFSHIIKHQQWVHHDHHGPPYQSLPIQPSPSCQGTAARLDFSSSNKRTSMDLLSSSNLTSSNHGSGGPRLKRPLVNINSWDGNGIAITTGCNWTEEGKKLTWRKPYPKLVLPPQCESEIFEPRIWVKGFCAISWGSFLKMWLCFKDLWRSKDGNEWEWYGMTLFSNECISALNQGQVNMPINPFKVCWSRLVVCCEVTLVQKAEFDCGQLHEGSQVLEVETEALCQSLGLCALPQHSASAACDPRP